MHWINCVYHEVFVLHKEDNFIHFKNIIESIKYKTIYEYNTNDRTDDIDINDTENEDIFKESIELRFLVDRYMAGCNIFKVDLLLVDEIYNMDSIDIYPRAIIHGIKHYGRGQEYVESEKTNEIKINNKLIRLQCNNKNILSQHWHNKSNYSSWFMMNNQYTIPKSKNYGQHNFFRSTLKKDQRITGLPMASCSIRKTEQMFTVDADVPLTGI